MVDKISGGHTELQSFWYILALTARSTRGKFLAVEETLFFSALPAVCCLYVE